MRLISVVGKTLRCLALVVRETLAGRVSVRDLSRALEAFTAVVAVRVAPQRFLRRQMSAARNEPDAALIALFRRVSRHHPLSPNCLHRSLALQMMLARRGVATTLRIGLGRRPNLVPGHAWLEWEGRVINDEPEVIGRYTPLVFGEEALMMVYAR